MYACIYSQAQWSNSVPAGCSSNAKRFLFGLLRFQVWSMDPILGYAIKSFVISVFGSVFNLARNEAADKLKEGGDVTDEKWGEKIVHDLHDIKKKLDGLSRKDLLASSDFLEQGIVAVKAALDEAKPTSKDEANADQDDGSKTTESTMRSESDSGVQLREAIELLTTIQKRNNTSSLVAAKECFKTAREEATRAFNNEALSLPDRIMATKFRVVAQILECLQDTKAAVDTCMLFLEKLHNLPAIGKTFSAYFKGGIKSKLHKDSRLENIKSVLSLNFGISRIVARFTGELPNINKWPRIHLSTRGETIHPLVIDPVVVMEIFDMEKFQLPANQLTLDTAGFGLNYVINSKREVLWVDEDATCINILNRSGNMKRFCELRQATANPTGDNQYPVALTIDRDDNVFLVICFRDSITTKYGHVLFVYDPTGNEQHEHVLDLPFFISALNLCVVNNDIFIHKNFDDFIHICDSKGNLKSRLPLEQNSSYHSSDFISMQCVTDDRDIVTCTDENVLVYTKEGKLRRMIKVSEMIKKGDEIKGARYNNVTSQVEVLVGKKSSFETRSYYILSFSKSGEIDSRLNLPVKQLLDTLTDTLRETLEKKLKEATRIRRPAASQTQAVDQEETRLDSAKGTLRNAPSMLVEFFEGPVRTRSQGKSLATTLAITLAESLGETQRWEITLVRSLVGSLAQILEREMIKTESTGMIGALVQSGQLEKILRETLEETLTVTGTLTVRPPTLREKFVERLRHEAGITSSSEQKPRKLIERALLPDPNRDPLVRTLVAVLQGRDWLHTSENSFLFSLTPYPSCHFLQHPAGPIALMTKNDKKASIIFL